MTQRALNTNRTSNAISPCFLAPICTAGILAAIFAAFGLFPFGEKTLSWCDMNQQVIPLMLDFKDILAGKGSLFLNLQNAGGMNFWGVFLFFLSSPFTFLVVFVEKSQIFLFVNLLVWAKMMVCAFTAGVFFQKRFPLLSLPEATGLSTLYAFCGYSLFYYQNIVWLDMMYLFPLLLLSLLSLAEKGRILPYILVFSAMMAVHFYLSYMIVLFLLLGCVLYIYFMLRPSERGRASLLLGIGTAISALLTAPIWLPSLLEYAASARTGDLFTNLTTGNFLTRLDTTLPVLFCTAGILAALPAAFSHISFKSPARNLLCLLFILLLLPVIIDPINKMWHTGSYQAFPVRYGYITIFIGLILMAYLLSRSESNGLGKRVELSRTAVALSILSVGIVLFLAEYLLRTSFSSITSYTRTLWGSPEALEKLSVFAFIAACSYFLLFLFRSYRQIQKPLFSALFSLLILMECLFNGCIYIGSAARDADSYAPVLDLADRIDCAPYRVKMQSKYFDVNLIGSLGYPSLSHYTSLTSKDYMYTMKRLGYSSYWMEVNSNGGTQLTDYLLGNRYIIKSISSCSPEDDVVYQNESYAIVKNPEVSSFGAVFQTNSIEELAQIQTNSRVDIQTSLFHTFFPTERSPIYEYAPIDCSDVRRGTSLDGKGGWYLEDEAYVGGKGGILYYEITVEDAQTLYFDCFDEPHNYLREHINDSFDITVNGETIETGYPSQSNNGILCLGTFANTNVSIRIRVNKDVEANSFSVFGINQERLTHILQESTPVSCSSANNSLTFSAESRGEESYLFIPISNDGGFTATVNGKTAEIYQVFDTFMAVKLEKGSNTIQLSYVVPGMKISLLLFAAGIFLLIGSLWLLRRQPKWLARLEKPAQILCTTLGALVILCIYIAPVALYLSRRI